MSPVRQLVDDLVEKRLWPIALLLVVALVAIPVLIGGSSESSGTPAAEISPAAGRVASATPAVALVGPAEVRTRPGNLRDPFRRTKKKAAPSAKPAAKPSAAKAAAPSKGATKAGGATSGTTTSPSTAKPKPAPTVPVEPAAAAISRSVYETVAHIKGANADYEHPLDRLAVVGDKDNPALQYLGASRGGKYAIFLLGSSATAAGEAGACIVARPCRAIGLRKGETLAVEVADANANAGALPRHYTIEVTSLRRVERSSPAAAQRERDHVAEDGRDVLHMLAQDVPTSAALGRLRYGPATGTITLVAPA
jgi:hypothetical protein